MKLRRLSTRAAGFEDELAALTRYEVAQDEAIESLVRGIIADVRARGDAALLEHARRYDRTPASALADLEIPKAALASAFASLAAPQAEALLEAAARIRRYHLRQLAASWNYTEEDGTLLGQKITALDRVGLYVPGGRAAYPSSVLMNALPARVAGVRELVMTSPTPPGEGNALVLAAAHLAGVDRVFAIGGAQAIAALAYGTATVPRVDKIVGPGNAYVAAAKRQVFGAVGIDLIAGPSEILVICDGQTDPEWVALDLFSQGRARRGRAGDPAFARRRLSRCGAGRGRAAPAADAEARGDRSIARGARRADRSARPRRCVRSGQPRGAGASGAVGRGSARTVAEGAPCRSDFPRPLDLGGDWRLLRWPESRAADRRHRALFIGARRLRLSETHERDRRIA
jgi:hypothetical protein